MRRPRDRAPASLVRKKGTMMMVRGKTTSMVDLQNFRTVRKLLNILLFSCCAPARLPTAMPQLPTDNTFELFVSVNQLELLRRYCPPQFPPSSFPPSRPSLLCFHLQTFLLLFIHLFLPILEDFFLGLLCQTWSFHLQL